MVYQDGRINASLTSVSRDRFKFKLNPYTLAPLSLYQVFIVATNIANGISSRASVEITVPQSKLVALIRGGSSLYLRLGSSLVLDASASYDPDIPLGVMRDESTKRLAFEWECYRSHPSLSDECGLTFESLNNGMQVRVSSSVSEVGSTYGIIVSVSDVDMGRVSRSGEISITLSEPFSPMVFVSSKSLKINRGDQLVLYGSVNSSYAVRGIWSEWDDSKKMKMDVSSISMMNSSCWLSSGFHACNLVLRSNVLAGRSAPYTFLLSVSSSSAAPTVSSSISITVNSPPLAGSFVVTPGNGSALSTSFLLSASLWSDDDLPLSYEYRYLNEKSVGLVVRGRSESTYTSSMLPSGLSSRGFGLTCQLRVFDSLNANELASTVVIVKSKDTGLGMQELVSQMSGQLVESSGNVDDTKQMLSLGLSLLSVKDCSRVAVNCTSLNREGCERGSRPNSCGACLSGFEELSGSDWNSVCLSKSDYLSWFSSLSSMGSRSCSSNADCAPWGSCDLIQNPTVCVANARECLNNCSGHGRCGYVGVGHGFQLSECLLGDVSCEPVCECESGWEGSSCSTTREDMLAKVSLRTELARNLVDLTLLDEPSQDSIESWESSLSSLSEDEDELSADSALMLASVASTILEYASSLDLDSSVLSNVLSSLDASSSVMLSSSPSSSSQSLNLPNNPRHLRELSRSSVPHAHSLSESQSTSSPYLSTFLNSLDLYGSAMSSTFVSGQDPISSLRSSFRLTIAELSEDNLVVSLPLSSYEEMSNDVSASVAVESSVSSLSGMKISAFSVDSRLYKSDDGSSVVYSSNPLRVMYSNRHSPPESVLITLRSSREESYETVEPSGSLTVNTTCETGDYATYVLPCPNGVNISHQCGGVSLRLTTRCPIMQRVPSCEILSDSASVVSGVTSMHCAVESYTSTHIHCRCHLTSSSPTQSPSPSRTSSSPRVLSTEDSAVEGSGVLEVSSVTVLVGKQFFETIETAGDLNSASDLKQTLIVIMMYGILWSVGLLGILSCSCFQRVRISKSGATVALSEKKERAMLTRSNHDVKQYLMGYVNEVFPSVYQARSSLERLWNEIRKHHRYLLLFSTSGEISESRRMLTGVQLLTVQSMLMFILAVCYDLQVSLLLFLSILTLFSLFSPLLSFADLLVLSSLFFVSFQVTMDLVANFKQNRVV